MGRKKIYTDEEVKERRGQYMKAYNKERDATPEGRRYKEEYMKAYRQKPVVIGREKAYHKERNATPEGRQYMKAYNKERDATPEGRRYKEEYMKAYRQKREIKDMDYKRVLTRRSKGGYVSSIDRQLVYERDAYKCAYAGCNKIVLVGVPHSNPLQATIDHIIPISKGGLSIYSNMITMCRGCNCNTKKANRSSDETRLLELAHARNVEFGLVNAKTKWEKGQQDDRVAGMGGG